MGQHTSKACALKPCSIPQAIMKTVPLQIRRAVQEALVVDLGRPVLGAVGVHTLNSVRAGHCKREREVA